VPAPYSQQARPSVKLLYVTPEQLVKSDSLRGLLQDLRQRQLLARFVIDEVGTTYSV
jgi:bloom syndrome protein